MRTIRVADPSHRHAPTAPQRRSRLVDWLATVGMVGTVLGALVLVAPIEAKSKTLTLTPGIVAPGQTVVVHADGLAARTDGRVLVDGSLASVKFRTDSGGHLNIPVRIPANATIGAHMVVAQQRSGDDWTSVGSATLVVATVSAPKAATVAPPLKPESSTSAATSPATKPKVSTSTKTSTSASTSTKTTTRTAVAAATTSVLAASSLGSLPQTGTAWKTLFSWANKSASPDLSDQNDSSDIVVLAKALVYQRTGADAYRSGAIALIKKAVGTEAGGRTLAEARNLPGFVIAAGLVNLKDADPSFDSGTFRPWLRKVLTESMSEGVNLVWTQEHRPNNWGMHATAARAAIAAYLGDANELARTAQVFRGWLGDRSAYAGFKFGDTSWQCDPAHPVGINPAGCTKSGHSIDGVLADDQRRAGGFTWPPQKENYVWEALQGATLAAEILSEHGYAAWSWGDKALLRAVEWLYDVDNFPATGDDSWEPYLIDHAYGTNFASGAARPGKNFGFTDWMYGS